MSAMPNPPKPPRHRIGAPLLCEARRIPLRVDGLSDAPVPWPYTMIPGRPSLIVTGALAEAVRTRPATEVARRWGVSRETAMRWRAALGVRSAKKPIDPRVLKLRVTMSAAQIATAIGVAPKTVSNWLSGARPSRLLSARLDALTTD